MKLRWPQHGLHASSTSNSDQHFKEGGAASLAQRASLHLDSSSSAPSSAASSASSSASKSTLSPWLIPLHSAHANTTAEQQGASACTHCDSSRAGPNCMVSRRRQGGSNKGQVGERRCFRGEIVQQDPLVHLITCSRQAAVRSRRRQEAVSIAVFSAGK